MATPILETKRLILRPASMLECAVLDPLFNDYETVKYMAVPWPLPSDCVTAYTRDKVLPEMAIGKNHNWTLWDKASNAPMGRMDLGDGEIGPNKSEHRGYWIGRPFQGRGFMSEAMAATADYGFTVMNMATICSRIAQANTGSNRLQEMSGARVIRTMDVTYPSGEQPSYLWELTPEAWRTSPLKHTYG